MKDRLSFPPFLPPAPSIGETCALWAATGTVGVTVAGADDLTPCLHRPAPPGPVALPWGRPLLVPRERQDLSLSVCPGPPRTTDSANTLRGLGPGCLDWTMSAKGSGAQACGRTRGRRERRGEGQWRDHGPPTSQHCPAGPGKPG